MNIKETNARVWQVTVSDKRKNTVIANVSTYDGTDKDDNPIYSNWNARFVGDAFKPAKKLDEGEKICITNAMVTSNYDKKSKKVYTTLTVFDFEEPKDFSK